MRFKDINAKLHQMESDYDLFDIELDGWCAWPQIRMAFAQRLMKGNELVSGFSFLTRQDRLRLLASDFWAMRQVAKTPYLFWTNVSGLRESVGDQFKDVVVDDLISSMSPADFTKIDLIVNRAFLDKRERSLNRGVLSSSIFDLLSFFMPLSSMMRQEIESVSIAFVERCRREDTFLKEAEIVSILTRYARYKAAFSRLLKRISPKFLIKTTHSDYSLVAAAKELDVTVVELQHGSPDCEKLPYSWSEGAKDYKSKLPLPDKIFLYGDFSQVQLRKNRFWDEELISIGSLRMAAWRKLIVGEQLQSADDKKEGLTVTVSSQGVDVDKVVTFLSDFISQAIASDLKITINIKLHPVWEKDKSNYSPLMTAYPDQVNVYLGDEEPSTYHLIAGADLHLSIYSTTHYESLALGTPTVILPFKNHERIADMLRDRPKVFLVQSSEELLSILKNLNGERVKKSESDYYFRFNTLDNMHTHLDYR